MVTPSTSLSNSPSPSPCPSTPMRCVEVSIPIINVWEPDLVTYYTLHLEEDGNRPYLQREIIDLVNELILNSDNDNRDKEDIKQVIDSINRVEQWPLLTRDTLQINSFVTLNENRYPFTIKRIDIHKRKPVKENM